MKVRKANPLPSFFGFLASIFLAGPAWSAVETQVAFTLELSCSDADGTKHPKKLQLLQELSVDDIEALQNGRLLVIYERDGDDAGKGKISVTARLLRAAGGSQKLGKVSATLNRVTGDTLGVADVGLEPQEGDAVRWTFKFKKFRPLDAGQCALLLVGPTRPSEGCGPYPDPSTSRYPLPFHPGQDSVMSQGNCSPIGSHRFAARHAYDFALPVGTELLSIDGGIVEFLNDRGRDGTGLREDENVLRIRHDDGTFANYVHLAQNGALVVQGERVERGQPIASSGNSGGTGGVPHLHLQLTTCRDRNVCGTLPITFNNTSAHPDGLQAGKLYRAQ